MIDEIKDFIRNKSKESWNKMGDTGSNSYILNEESYWYGYYNALEEIEDIINKYKNIDYEQCNEYQKEEYKKNKPVIL